MIRIYIDMSLDQAFSNLAGSSILKPFAASSKGNIAGYKLLEVIRY
jgi:hypothetical protein